MNAYDHIVQIDLKSRELRIYRVSPTGERELFTSATLPRSQGWSKELDSFARQLGENLLMDSPSARKILEL